MRAASKGNESLAIMLDLYEADSFEQQCRVTERAIDFCCRFLQENKQHKYNLGEDQLTVDIIGQLKALSFDAEHDTQVGGHCDILVRGKKGFLWIAESKKHNSYEWLLEGFNQLCSRYLTGVDGQDTGDLIIFCTNRNAMSVLKTWFEKISSVDRDFTFDESEIDSLVFRSTHSHEGSGRKIKVRHKMVVLWWAGAATANQ